MNQTITKYSASFTAGALLLDETTRVIDYILNDEIDEKRTDIIKKNVFKINSESARKRVLQEIKKRYNAVDKAIWEIFKQASLNERKILALYITAKTYALLADFLREVILEKWKGLKKELSDRDIEIFFERKSAEHPEIDEWTQNTKDKVRQVILKIMSDAGILNGNKIMPLEASNSFWKIFVNIGDAWFLELALLNKAQRDKIIGMKL